MKLRLCVWLTAVSCLFLSGCTTSFWQRVSELETFNFRYILAPEDRLGGYLVPIQFDNLPCQSVRLTDAELYAMVTTGTHQHNSVTYDFEFDMLTPCNSDRLVIDDAQIESLRANLANAEVSTFGGGNNKAGMDIVVGNTQLVVYSLTVGPLLPGPLDLNGTSGTADIPAASVGSVGDPFSPLNMANGLQFLQLNYLNRHTNPTRYTGDFRMIAAQPNSTARLIIWDGEFVLQD